VLTWAEQAQPFVTPRIIAKLVAKILLEPRIQIGVSGGIKATDQVYAGLNWYVPITDTVFAEFGAGSTVHNGNLDSGPRPRWVADCCSGNMRLSV
jgi:hypothetical protein